MSLPTSREITATTASPVPSTAFNALQDQIIGAKHPSLDYHVAAPDFAAETTGTTLSDGQWTFTAVAIISAGLKGIKVGTRITTFALTYNRGGAGTITVTVCKRLLGAKTTLATLTINTGTGMTTGSVAVNYIVEAGASVYVRVQCDNAAHVVDHGLASVDRL